MLARTSSLAVLFLALLAAGEGCGGSDDDATSAGDSTTATPDTSDDSPPDPPAPPPRTPPPTGTVFAGFAERVITPKVETFTDTNGNNEYDDGEAFEDLDGDGAFDPVYLAGFQSNRLAFGVHDDISVVAAVFDDGDDRVALVTIDAVGWMYEEVGDVRAALPDELQISRLIMHATHNHGVPDTQGLWGPSFTETGKDPAYMQRVKDQSIAAIAAAVAALEPATVHIGTATDDENRLGVVDTRIPNVIDPTVYFASFRSAADDSVLGTLVNWGNHVETVWSGNRLVTADFAGYVRRGLSSGRDYDGRVERAGVGGVTLFFAGNVGGLMTTLPSVPLVDPYTDETFVEPSFEKARAQGYRVADMVQDQLESGASSVVAAPTIEVYRKAFPVQIANQTFVLASRIGLIRRDSWVDENGIDTTETEVGLLAIGDLWIATVPGELYPEIARGGVERLPGGDFDIAPIEVPALQPAMGGAVNMMFNLANDSIGYIIPKSEWDESAPYIEPDGAYGESNSLGPETAPAVHRELLGLIRAAGGD